MIYGIGAGIVTGGALLTYYQCCRRQPMKFDYESRIDPLYNVFESTLNYLKDYPESYREDGIWRQSGNKTYATLTFRHVVDKNQTEFPMGTNRKFGTSFLSIHDAVSALKIALENNFQPQYFAGHELMTKLKDLTVDATQFTAILKSHIDGLVKKGLVKEASILHNMLHLGYCIQREQEFNQMTETNVAKLHAPHFLRMLGVPESTSETLFEYETKRQTITELLKGPLTSNVFAERFPTPVNKKQERVAPSQRPR